MSLLLQGIAAVAALPACTHGDYAGSKSATAIPAEHPAHHTAARHHEHDATTGAHAAHPQFPVCECGEDCGASCALHASGQLLPDERFAPYAPPHDGFPPGADEYPKPTVVTPRPRPPTPS